MRIFYYNMRHLPLENRSSELRRISASRSKGTSRRRRSAHSETRKIVKKVSVDVGFQYGQPLPDAILKTGDNLENLSKRIDHLEKEHSVMMAEHKMILDKTASIEKTHSRILKEHNYIMDKAAEAKAQELMQAIKSKKGGATRRRKRRVYK